MQLHCDVKTNTNKPARSQKNNSGVVTNYTEKREEIGRKLLRGDYWLGMTDEMAKISLGKPKKINRSVGSWGTHEQWVYEGIYLYFENGVLISYQN